MKRSILVLEGGAMRSLYTSGVLDVFMDKHIEFDCVIGVSAGALVGSNYISKQKGRTANINISYCKNSEYIGLKAIRNSNGLVGFNYLFEEICKNAYPFDEETFNNSEKRFIIGVTNCETGKTEYFEKGEYDTNTLLQASSSMPLVSQVVEIKGKPYLDGAIDCNVPIKWAMEQGYEKIVVVLTRNREYKKEPVSNKIKKIYELKYKQYPELLKSIYNRPEKYNKLYEEINTLEKENKIFVFQPSKPLKVSRLERNKEKLKELYEQGITEAEDRLVNLEEYLKY